MSGARRCWCVCLRPLLSACVYASALFHCLRFVCILCYAHKQLRARGTKHFHWHTASERRSVKRSDQGTRLWLQSTFDPHIACTFCGALNFINTQEGKTRVAFTEIEAGRQRATAAE